MTGSQELPLGVANLFALAGEPPDVADLAPYNDDADVDAFLEGLDDAVRRLK